MSGLTPKDIQLSSRAAENFIRLYYGAYDSPSRLAELPNFYRDFSSLSWNGRAFKGISGLNELVTKMPQTHHTVQSYDCHPIPGASPPSLLITVSGNVTHGRDPPPDHPAPASKRIDTLPRVFSQTFILVPDGDAAPSKPGEIAKYCISADTLRFVG